MQHKNGWMAANPRPAAIYPLLLSFYCGRPCCSRQQAVHRMQSSFPFTLLPTTTSGKKEASSLKNRRSPKRERRRQALNFAWRERRRHSSGLWPAFQREKAADFSPGHKSCMREPKKNRPHLRLSRAAAGGLIHCCFRACFVNNVQSVKFPSHIDNKAETRRHLGISV